MSTPSGTPDPYDPPGPDATPEQDALVRGLLESLRADDPPMPDHVVARLDAALAQERLSGAAPLVTGAGAGAGAGDGDEDRATAIPGDATVTVLPQQRRRPERSTTALQWLVGAAAAVLVVGGVGAVVRGTFTGSSSDTAASGALAEQAQERVLATGTTYDKDTLAEKVQALVTDPAGEGVAPGLAPSDSTDATDSTAEPDSGTPGPDVGQLSAGALAGCVEQLAGATGIEPVVVDRAVYEGRSALVVVLVTTGDPSTLDIFVVSPDCTRDSGDVLEFQRVPAP